MAPRVSRIILYDEPSVPEIGLGGLARFVRDATGLDPEIRGPVTGYGGPDAPALVAASRIYDLGAPFARHEPSPGAVLLEGGRPGGGAGGAGAAYYDGIELQNAFGRMIPGGELGEGVFHAVFTDRLTCTYDGSDRRYHGRAVICSNPSVISTSGMVEAPARPRGHYAWRIAESRAGAAPGSLGRGRSGEYLERRDGRLSAVAEGYLLQALLYYATGEPFCGDRDCRLFNAHWQEDLLHAQLRSGRLCERHRGELGSMKDLN